MQYKLKIFLLLMGIIGGALTSSFSQNSFPPVEKVTLFTDRNMYITGEEISFAASVDQTEKTFISTDNSYLSKVLYVEIISGDGKKLATGKYPIEQGLSSGTLSIPAEMITGVYFVRAYTKYMRNAGPATYAMLMLRIINPSKADVLTGNDSFSFKDPANNGILSDKITVELIKKSYQTGETVTSFIKLDRTVAMSTKFLSVSVVPAGTANQITYSVPSAGRQFSRLQYLPEINGLSLTGNVLQSEAGSQHPANNQTVTLSIIESLHDFQTVKTDDQGKFAFLLPLLPGFADVYVGLKESDTSKYKLLVDNEFCSMPVDLPEPMFSLSESERKLALQMARNREVTALFNPEYNVWVSDSMKQPYKYEGSFYGTPNYTLFLKDYIQLPSLEEYFNELPGYVRIRKKGGERYFKVQGNQPEMEFYDPLVLVDWVNVNDPERILKASPGAIDRIEMFNTPYLKGNTIFGGIISIITKKGDMAGVELPPSGYFISYHFLNSSYQMPGTYPENLPDSRNTAYFNPNLVLNDANEATLSFRTPRTPGNWIIQVNGITKHGSVFEVQVPFTIDR